MAQYLLISVTLASSLLAGCANLGELCRPGEQRAIADQLYFGTTKPNGIVSNEDWSDFLAGAVTPRFPAGLTSWPASGQWQSGDGSLIRENAFVLNLVHPVDEASEAAVRSIVSEYKSRFQQEAVLRIKSYACSSL
jgi:hypothetical protein